MLYKPREVEKLLGIESARLRLWARTFAPWLSDTAQPKQKSTFESRLYTAHDVELLRLVKEQRQGDRPADFKDITASLPPPEEWKAKAPPEADESPVPVVATTAPAMADQLGVAFQRAIEEISRAKDATITAQAAHIAGLESEVERLRSELDVLRNQATTPATTPGSTAPATQLPPEAKSEPPSRLQRFSAWFAAHRLPR